MLITKEILSNLLILINTKQEDELLQASDLIEALTGLTIPSHLLYIFLIEQAHDLNELSQEQIDRLTPKYEVWSQIKIHDSNLHTFQLEVGSHFFTIKKKDWQKQKNKALYRIYMSYTRHTCKVPKKFNREQKRILSFISMRVNDELAKVRKDAIAFKQAIGKNLYNDLLAKNAFRLQSLKEMKDIYNNLSQDTLDSYNKNLNSPLSLLILFYNKPLEYITSTLGDTFINLIMARSKNQVRYLLTYTNTCVPNTTNEELININIELITELLKSTLIISSIHIHWILQTAFTDPSRKQSSFLKSYQIKFIEFLKNNNSLSSKAFYEKWEQEGKKKQINSTSDLIPDF